MSVASVSAPEIIQPAHEQLRARIIVWSGQFALAMFVVIVALTALAATAGASPFDGI